MIKTALIIMCISIIVLGISNLQLMRRIDEMMRINRWLKTQIFDSRTSIMKTNEFLKHIEERINKNDTEITSLRYRRKEETKQ